MLLSRGLEYTSEAFWKVVKSYLDVKEGIICNSPKSCFKEAFKVGLLSEEETVKILEMVDDRNLTSHTYHEEIAEEIYRGLEITGNLWTKFADGLLKGLSLVFGAGRQKNKNEL